MSVVKQPIDSQLINWYRAVFNRQSRSIETELINPKLSEIDNNNKTIINLNTKTKEQLKQIQTTSSKFQQYQKEQIVNIETLSTEVSRKIESFNEMVQKQKDELQLYQTEQNKKIDKLKKEVNAETKNMNKKINEFHELQQNNTTTAHQLQKANETLHNIIRQENKELQMPNDDFESVADKLKNSVLHDAIRKLFEPNNKICIPHFQTLSVSKKKSLQISSGLKSNKAFFSLAEAIRYSKKACEKYTYTALQIAPTPTHANVLLIGSEITYIVEPNGEDRVNEELIEYLKNESIAYAILKHEGIQTKLGNIQKTAYGHTAQGLPICMGVSWWILYKFALDNTDTDFQECTTKLERMISKDTDKYKKEVLQFFKDLATQMMEFDNTVYTFTWHPAKDKKKPYIVYKATVELDGIKKLQAQERTILPPVQNNVEQQLPPSWKSPPPQSNHNSSNTNESRTPAPPKTPRPQNSNGRGKRSTTSSNQNFSIGDASETNTTRP